MRQKTMWSRRDFVASGLAGVGLTATLPSVLASSGARQESGQGLRIPITMCHGVTDRLTLERFERYLGIARELEFSTINYDRLYAWLTGTDTLPDRPLMIDVDHPVGSVAEDMFPLMTATPTYPSCRSTTWTGRLFGKRWTRTTRCWRNSLVRDHSTLRSPAIGRGPPGQPLPIERRKSATDLAGSGSSGTSAKSTERFNATPISSAQRVQMKPTVARPTRFAISRARHRSSDCLRWSWST